MAEENFDEIAEVGQEAAKHELHRDGPVSRWIEIATLSTMVMALLGAVGGLLAAKTGNEAIVSQHQQLTERVELNRKQLESEVVLTRLAVLESAGKKPDSSLIEKLNAANQAASDYDAASKKKLTVTRTSLRTHELFAISTTILSIAITLTGMAVLVRKRRVWFGGLSIGCVGLVLFVSACVSMATI